MSLAICIGGLLEEYATWQFLKLLVYPQKKTVERGTVNNNSNQNFSTKIEREMGLFG